MLLKSSLSNVVFHTAYASAHSFAHNGFSFPFPFDVPFVVAFGFGFLGIVSVRPLCVEVGLMRVVPLQLLANELGDNGFAMLPDKHSHFRATLQIDISFISQGWLKLSGDTG